MYILYVFEAKIRFSKIFIPNLGKFLLSKYINSAWPYGKTNLLDPLKSLNAPLHS